MTPNQRRFDQNLFPKHLKPVARAQGTALGNRDSGLGTSGRNRRHIGHRVHACRFEIEDGVADDIIRLRLLRKGHYDRTSPDDPGLLPRDLGKRLPPPLLALQPDATHYTMASIPHITSV